jgi:hypothetical protein
MKNFIVALTFLAALSGCGVGQPELKSFQWSRDSYPPPGFSGFDQVLPPSASNSRLVTIWTTTYARQDMSEARGWLESNPSEVVLCFSAPDYPPNSPVLDVAAAYPTLLSYDLSGQDTTSNIRFGGNCGGR